MKTDTKVCLVWAAIVLFIVCLVTFKAKADHVHVGQPVDAFLYCENPDDAVEALSRFIFSKKDEGKSYRQYMIESGNTCLDTRSFLGRPIPCVPIKRMEGYSVMVEGTVFHLWRVDLHGKIMYTWEGDEITQLKGKTT